jgi:hypothetical protein
VLAVDIISFFSITFYLFLDPVFVRFSSQLDSRPAAAKVAVAAHVPALRPVPTIHRHNPGKGNPVTAIATHCRYANANEVTRHTPHDDGDSLQSNSKPQGKTANKGPYSFDEAAREPEEFILYRAFPKATIALPTSS